MRTASCGFGAHGQLELGSAQRHAEHGAARFEEAARAQAAEPDSVVTNALDKLSHDGYRVRVVAGDAECAASRRARGPAFIFKLVVADVVEGLDDCGPGQPALNY